MTRIYLINFRSDRSSLIPTLYEAQIFFFVCEFSYRWFIVRQKIGTNMNQRCDVQLPPETFADLGNTDQNKGENNV